MKYSTPKYWSVDVRLSLQVKAKSAEKAVELVSRGISFSNRILGGRFRPDISIGARELQEHEF